MTDENTDKLRFQIDEVALPAREYVGSFIVTKQDAVTLMQQQYTQAEDDILDMLKEELDASCLRNIDDTKCQCCTPIARIIKKIQNQQERRNIRTKHLRNCDGNPCECGADPLPRIKP